MDTTALKIDAPKNCEAWLALLPLTNAQQAHAQLAGQLKLLNAATVPATERLQILELLREPVALVQAERAKRFCHQPVPLDQPTAVIWNGVVALWLAMADGYRRCSDGGDAQRALVRQRALRYTGLAMHDYNRVYRAVPAALWQQLHQLFAAAEAGGFAADPVTDANNRIVAATSCAAAYQHVLLAQHATPDALTPVQMAAVERWLEQWMPLVKLAATPVANSKVPAVAVDLHSSTGVRVAQNPEPSATMRYLDLDRLSAILIQLVAGLRHGKSPAELGLGPELKPPACEALLLLLGLQWCGAGTGRTEERMPSAMKVMVSLSIAAMHFHLTGRVFRQPGGRLTAREEEDMAMFGRVSERTEQAMLTQRSGALENWEIINHSTSGFLGMCREPDAATGISHNQLLGLRTANGKTFYLGIVQRLLVDEKGAMSVGLRLIPGTPQAVAARVTGAVVAGGNKYDRALLMPEHAARKVPPTLIVAPPCYQPNRALDLYTDAQQTVKLVALLEKGTNFERMTFSAG